MRDGRVRRLIRRAPQSRWAFGRLEKAGDAGDRDAIDAVWALWLATGDQPFRPLLTRWGTPSRRAEDSSTSELVLDRRGVPDRDVLAAASRRPWHPIVDIARERIRDSGDAALVDAFCAAALDDPELAPFCVRERLAPADPIDRAVFFLRTGQAAELQAVDPDGAEVATAYRTAGPAERERLRTAAAEIGIPDLLRRLAGGAGGRLIAPEGSAHLVDRVVERSAWKELWLLLQDLPLTEAAAAARRLPAAWQPADESGAAVLAALRDADPRTLAGAVDAIRDRRTTELAVPGRVWAGALARHRRRLAVVSEPRDGEALVTLFDLATTPVTRVEYRSTAPESARIVASTGAFVATRWFVGDAWHHPIPGRLTRYDFTGMRDLAGPDAVRFGFPADLVWRRRGDSRGEAVVLSGFEFAISRPTWPDYVWRLLLPEQLHSGEPHAPLLVRGDEVQRPEGVWRRDTSGPGHLAAFDPDGRLRWMSTDTGQPPLTPTSIAAAERSNLVALAGGGALAVLDLHAMTPSPWRLVAVAPLPPLAVEVVFTGPDELVVTAQEGEVTSWRLVGESLEKQAAISLPGARSPVALPGRDEVALLYGEGRVRRLDARTLAEVDTHRDFAGLTGTRLWGSPDGRRLALGGHGRVWVQRTRPELLYRAVDQPLSTWTLADLHALKVARRKRGRYGKAVGPLLAVLDEVLSERFGTEIELSGDAPLTAAWEIALAEEND